MIFFLLFCRKWYQFICTTGDNLGFQCPFEKNAWLTHFLENPFLKDTFIKILVINSTTIIEIRYTCRPLYWQWFSSFWWLWCNVDKQPIFYFVILKMTLNHRNNQINVVSSQNHIKCLQMWPLNWPVDLENSPVKITYKWRITIIVVPTCI